MSKSYHCGYCDEETKEGKDIRVSFGTSVFKGFFPLCEECQKFNTDDGVAYCVVDDIEQRFMESNLSFEKEESGSDI